MSDPVRQTAWQWLDDERYQGVRLIDFRPGWDSLDALYDPISREEFEQRLRQAKHTTPLRVRVRTGFTQADVVHDPST